MSVLEDLAERIIEEEQSFRIVVFDSWTVDLMARYMSVEESAFRPELRYTPEELEERAEKPFFEGLILSDYDGPAGVILCYEGIDPDDLYLDTLAVRTSGEGMGSQLLGILLSLARKSGYRSVSLDTERRSEKNQELVSYYKRFGFRENNIEDSRGNISMRVQLTGIHQL